MQTSNISSKFSKLMLQKRKALIPYIIPGITSLEDTRDLVLSLEDAGSDIIKIGIPFSDPVVDGPVLQKASQLALNNGVNTDEVFETIDKIRQNSTIPIVFLVYYNCIFRYGRECFIKKCQQCGVDGLIIPDLPFEERQELEPLALGASMDIITIVSPVLGERMEKILPYAKGFVHCVCTTGASGEGNSFDVQLIEFLQGISEITKIPRVIDFDISSPEQVNQISDYCEGVVVGSALLKRVMTEGVASGLTFIRELRALLNRG
jgi:tryptophan synthase alpha chain